jgi:uncharacterized protein YbjT (DUF2867 family)
MAFHKRTMLIAPDDIGGFAAVALVEPGRFSHRAVDIEGEFLTAEQIASAISEVSRCEIAVDHILRNLAENLVHSKSQIAAQLWF